MMLDRSFSNEVQTNLENAATFFDLGDMDACIYGGNGGSDDLR